MSYKKKVPCKVNMISKFLFCLPLQGLGYSNAAELKYQREESQMDCDYCPGTDWTGYERRMWAESHFSTQAQVHFFCWEEGEIYKKDLHKVFRQ